MYQLHGGCVSTATQDWPETRCVLGAQRRQRGTLLAGCLSRETRDRLFWKQILVGGRKSDLVYFIAFTFL